MGATRVIYININDFALTARIKVRLRRTRSNENVTSLTTWERLQQVAIFTKGLRNNYIT